MAYGTLNAGTITPGSGNTLAISEAVTVPTPTATTHATTKAYVDVAINKNWDSTNSSILGGKSLVLTTSRITLTGSATVSLGSTTYTNLVAGSTIVATIEFAIDNSVTTPQQVNGDVQITDATSTVVAAKTYEDESTYRRMETIVGSAIFTSVDPVAVKTFTVNYVNAKTSTIHTQADKPIILHIREYI